MNVIPDSVIPKLKAVFVEGETPRIYRDQEIELTAEDYDSLAIGASAVARGVIACCTKKEQSHRIQGLRKYSATFVFFDQIQ